MTFSTNTDPGRWLALCCLTSVYVFIPSVSGVPVFLQHTHAFLSSSHRDSLSSLYYAYSSFLREGFITLFSASVCLLTI